MCNISTDMIDIVTKIRIDAHAKGERVRIRKFFEDIVISIIQDNLRNLTEFELEWIMNLIDFDYFKSVTIPKGNPQSRRFGSLFAESNKRKILNNDMDDINECILEIYCRENIDRADEFIRNINGIGEGFVSLLLYLKDRSKYNVMLDQTVKGIEKIFNTRIPSGSFKRRYEVYNKLANELRRCLSLEPQEVDLILSSSML